MNNDVSVVSLVKTLGNIVDSKISKTSESTIGVKILHKAGQDLVPIQLVPYKLSY